MKTICYYFNLIFTSFSIWFILQKFFFFVFLGIFGGVSCICGSRANISDSGALPPRRHRRHHHLSLLSFGIDAIVAVIGSCPSLAGELAVYLRKCTWDKRRWQECGRPPQWREGRQLATALSDLFYLSNRSPRVIVRAV